MATSVREKQNSPAAESSNPQNLASLAWVWFLVQGVSSISLMIINKKLAQQFPYPVRFLTHR